MVYAARFSNSLFRSRHLNVKLAFGATSYGLSIVFSNTPRPPGGGLSSFSFVLPYSQFAILRRVIGVDLLGRRVAFCVTKHVRVRLHERDGDTERDREIEG